MDSFLIQCLVLAGGLITCLLLFFSLKREVYKYMNRDRKEFEELRQRLEATQLAATQQAATQKAVALPAARTPLQLEAARDHTSEPEDSGIQRSLVSLAHSGFNMNRRVQAMRMLRRGEDVAHVAAALGVPKQEVELLVRVQELGAKTGTLNESDPPAE